MKNVSLLILLALFGCSKDNRDNSQGDIPQDTIVSAFFGLDNVLPGLLCNQPGSNSSEDVIRCSKVKRVAGRRSQSVST